MSTAAAVDERLEAIAAALALAVAVIREGPSQEQLRDVADVLETTKYVVEELRSRLRGGDGREGGTV